MDIYIYIKPDKHLLSTIKHNKATSFRAQRQYHHLQHFLLFCTYKNVFVLQPADTDVLLNRFVCKTISGCLFELSKTKSLRTFVDSQEQHSFQFVICFICRQVQLIKAAKRKKNWGLIQNMDKYNIPCRQKNLVALSSSPFNTYPISFGLLIPYIIFAFSTLVFYVFFSITTN